MEIQPTKLIDFNINWLQSVSSTNDFCMQSAAKGAGEGLVVAAHFQQNGRGQRGNVWSSRLGKNLTFSILLRPVFLRVEEQFLISKITALSLCEFVRTKINSDEVRIKWPNDIYINNSKVAGVLIESCFSSSTLEQTVVGIGLNMNQVEFPENLPNPTSLALQAGQHFGLELSLSEYLKIFAKWYGFLQGENRNIIDHSYLQQLYRLGIFSSYISNNVEFTAKIVGISQIGELMLQTLDGNVKKYAFKEVAFVV